MNNNNQNPLFECFFSLPPEQFALLSVLIGIVISDFLDIDQQNILGSFLSNLGGTISTISAQAAFLESNNSKNDKLLSQIQSLKNQICMLEKELIDQ